MYKKIMEPKIFKGNSFFDKRGNVKFINDFDLIDNEFDIKFRRIYIVNNHKQGFIRAWHGHKEESKAVLCIHGEAHIAAVNLDTKIISEFILSSTKPEILFIPKNYANGFKSLSENCVIMFFSDKTLEESSNDNFRFDYLEFGNIWEEKYF